MTAGVFGAVLVLSALANAQTEKPIETTKQKTETNIRNRNPAKTSQISFTVRDPNDASVAGALVKLINEKTEEEIVALTNDDGVAQFNFLPRGRYKIEASSPGFKDYVNNLLIQQAVEPNVRIMLEVGFVTGIIVYDWSEIPLFRAIAQEDNETVKQSIDAGFDVNKKDESGDTALHVAVDHGNVEIIKFLLEKGAKVNSKNKAKLTPLWKNGDDDEETAMEIMRLLIKAGADVNVPNEEKETFLMLAAEDDELEAVRLLLEAGADPNLKDEDGETALDKADSAEVRELLVRYGAKSGDAAKDEN